MRTLLAPSLTLVASAFLAAPAALAQPSETEVAARRQLIAEAQQAHTAGNHQRALDLALRASRIQMTPSLRMFIETEQSEVGALAESLGSAELCIRETADPSVPERELVSRLCTELQTRLRPRLGRVIVEVPDPAPAGVEVTVAGRPLNSAFYGVSYAVTPGAVVIEARAPGREPFRQEVAVAAGQSATVRVALGEPAPAAPAPAVANTTTPTPAPSPSSSRGSLAGPAALLALGGASFVVMGILGGLRLSAESSLNAQCASPDATGLRQCDDPAAARSAYSSAEGYTIGTNVTFAVGVAAAGAGLVWLVVQLAGRKDTAPPRAALTPLVSPGITGASALVAF